MRRRYPVVQHTGWCLRRLERERRTGRHRRTERSAERERGSGGGDHPDHHDACGDDGRSDSGADDDGRNAQEGAGAHQYGDASCDGLGELRRGHVLVGREEEVVIRGVGLGLRWEFIDDLLARGGSDAPPVDFLEISPENYVGRGGYYPAALARIAASHRVLTHGLTMSLGGTDPLDARYLAELRAFLRDVRAPWHSDHLCFSSASGVVLHDLLPLRFTEESAQRVADRVKRAEDALGVPMAVENVTFYADLSSSMREAEWIAMVCERADCGLMLDVNNAYVNSLNFGFDVDEWMRIAPLERTVQIHVAGHEAFDEGDYVEGATGTILLDTHGADVSDPVLALLARVLPRTGPVPVVLERDQSIPPLDDLFGEVARIRAIYERALAG